MRNTIGVAASTTVEEHSAHSICLSCAIKLTRVLMVLTIVVEMIARCTVEQGRVGRLLRRALQPLQPHHIMMSITWNRLGSAEEVNSTGIQELYGTVVMAGRPSNNVKTIVLATANAVHMTGRILRLTSVAFSRKAIMATETQAAHATLRLTRVIRTQEVILRGILLKGIILLGILLKGIITLLTILLKEPIQLLILPKLRILPKLLKCTIGIDGMPMLAAGVVFAPVQMASSMKWVIMETIAGASLVLAAGRAVALKGA